MTHATPPPKPPAIVQQAPPTPSLKDIELVAGGKTYHIPVNGVVCNSSALFVSRIVQRPSERMTVVLSCDGVNAVQEVSDDPQPAAKR